MGTKFLQYPPTALNLIVRVGKLSPQKGNHTWYLLMGNPPGVHLADRASVAPNGHGHRRGDLGVQPKQLGDGQEHHQTASGVGNTGGAWGGNRQMFGHFTLFSAASVTMGICNSLRTLKEK